MRFAQGRAFGHVVACTGLAALLVITGCSSGDASAGGPSAIADPGAAASGAPAPGSPQGPSSAAPGTSQDPGGGATGPVAPFHIVGRVDTRDPGGPRLGWSGIEVRARFAGPSLAIVLEDTGTSYYDVSVDGAASVLLVTGGARPYTLATGLSPGAHELILTKRTETITGVTQLQGFVGTLVPSPVPTGRRIELIGDSISCGFGVLGPNETCPFSPDTQSEPRAWGAVAAKQLGALHTVTAVSGLGVLRNYGGDTTETMPDRYDRALANDPDSVWDHHAFEPDVLVVNLGTNDFSGGKGDPGPGFQTAYTTFLERLRARHPQAEIVAATSPMLSDDNRTKLFSYVTAAVAARKAAGDDAVSFVDIAEQTDADGYGCGYHPNIATQKRMAAELVAHVKPLMGW